MIKDIGNIRYLQRKSTKKPFHFALKIPYKSVFYFQKKYNIFYSKFGYPACPKNNCVFLQYFSSFYGFPHFSFHCFFIYLHPIVKIVYYITTIP